MRGHRLGPTLVTLLLITSLLVTAGCAGPDPAAPQSDGTGWPDGGTTGVRGPLARADGDAGPGRLGARTDTHWPDAGTTGARGPLARADGMSLTRPGQVVRGLDVVGQLTIDADGVVVRNVRVDSNGPYAVLVLGRGVVLEDVTLRGGPETSAALAASGSGQYVARRVDAAGAEDGVRLCDGCGLVDSFVHGLRGGEGRHNDAVTADGSRDWVVSGNTILNEHHQTGALWVGDARVGGSEGLVQGNLLAGGGWTVYAGPGTGPGIRFVDNAFSTRFATTSGLHGPVTGWTAASGTWRDNTWADGPAAGTAVGP